MESKTKILAITCLLFCSHQLQAQTFAEWFRQKKTQKEYLFQQIAGLQIYLEVAKKGYQLTSHGLQLISSFKDGDLSLHQDFFAAKYGLNSSLHAGQIIQEISNSNNQVKILCRSLLKVIASTLFLTEGEELYIRQVIGRILDELAEISTTEKQLQNEGELSLSDDERWMRLQGLLERVLSAIDFIRAFSLNISSMLEARSQENEELMLSRKLFGLK